MIVLTLVGAVTATDDDARYQVGSLHYRIDPTYGAQVYRYVYNNSGSTIAANLAVMQENGTDIGEVIVCGAAAPVARVMGVTVSSIATGYYGWVVCDGACLCTSDGGTTANTAQKTAASGKFTDGVTGTDELPLWAQATESPAGDGGTFIGLIRAL